MKKMSRKEFEEELRIEFVKGLREELKRRSKIKLEKELQKILRTMARKIILQAGGKGQRSETCQPLYDAYEDIASLLDDCGKVADRNKWLEDTITPAVLTGISAGGALTYMTHPKKKRKK